MWLYKGNDFFEAGNYKKALYCYNKSLKLKTEET